MDIKNLTTKQLMHGYKNNDITHQCLFCDYQTAYGEIYSYNNHFYDAEKRMQIHVEEQHAGSFVMLMDLPKKQNGISESQSNIIMLMYQNASDKEIAEKLCINESTVRHQRFMLKEKANQAKTFLAIYELLNSRKNVDDFLSIHQHAKQVDERYMATKKDEDKVCKDFLVSKNPLVIKSMPRKEKSKIILLRLIAQKFNNNQVYNEPQVNDILREIYKDYVSIRRYLVDYGFLKRSNDGKSYQKQV